MSNKDLDVSKMEHLPNGDIADDCRMEVGILGPIWSPIIRMRFYPKHRPNDHITVWKCRWISSVVGSWTPPPWLLQLLGQIKE